MENGRLGNQWRRGLKYMERGFFFKNKKIENENENENEYEYENENENEKAGNK